MKRLSLLMLLLFPVVVSAQKEGFTLSGKVGNFNSPSKIYLSYVLASQIHQDSALLKDGKFQFKGHIEGVTKAYLNLSYQGGGMHHKPYHMKPIYLEAGDIVVEGPDSLRSATASGTPANIDLERYNQVLRPYNNKIYEWIKATRALTEEQRKDTALIQNNNRKLTAIREEARMASLAFVESNPKSMVSLDIIIDEIGGKVPDYNVVEPLFRKLSTEVKSSAMGKKFSESLSKLKATSIGEIAPDFAQSDVSGKLIKLSDLRGKYVLIDFWASWCLPCRKENPHVLKAYEKYKEKGFEIIGISLDNNKSAWQKAIADDKLTWINVSDLKGRRNEASEMYYITAIPQNFLLDTEGKIVGKNLRGENLQKKLAEIFD